MTTSNFNSIIWFMSIAMVIGTFVLIKVLLDEGSKVEIIVAVLGILCFLSVLVFALCKKRNIL